MPSTLRLKLVLPVSDPSLAVSVIVTVPLWPATGVTVTVRADSTLKAMMPTEATRPAPVVIDPAVLADPLVRKAQELLSARIVGVRPRRDP